MPGSSGHSSRWPRPGRALAQLAVTGALVLWLGSRFAAPIVGWLAPAFSVTFEAMDHDFRALALGVGTGDRGRETLQLDADLAHPIEVAGQRLAPMGPGNSVRVDLTLGGVLQYPLMLIVLVLGWPAERAREWAWRAALLLPGLVLLLLPTPLTMSAELWFLVRDNYNPGAMSPLLYASRFLMGGGGLACAVVIGASIVLGSRRLAEPA